jgi:hypothetical protein
MWGHQNSFYVLQCAYGCIGLYAPKFHGVLPNMTTVPEGLNDHTNEILICD